MRELNIRYSNIRLQWEYCAPVIRNVAAATIILVALEALLIAWLSESSIHSLKITAAATAGVGLALLSLYRTVITQMIDGQIDQAEKKGYLADMPAIVKEFYDDEEKEVAFRHASKWLIVGGAIALFVIAEPRFAAGAFVAGAIFITMARGGFFANLLFIPIFMVLIGAAANPRFDLSGIWWWLGAVPFVWPFFVTIGGIQEEKESNFDMILKGFLFGTLLRRAVIRASEGTKDVREVYGSGLADFEDEDDSRNTGSVERGQSADSDKAADALAAQAKHYQES